MAVTYKALKKGVPGNALAPEKFYACPVKIRETGFREIAREISARSTVNPADVAAVLECMIEIIPEKLLLGHTVRLGDFGIFRLTLHSEGQETEKDVTRHTITGSKMNFLPGLVVKKALKRAEYIKQNARNRNHTDDGSSETLNESEDL